MTRGSIPILLLTLASAAVAAEPRWPSVKTADDLARRYALLVLRLDQHRPGYNDAYCGPAAWRVRAETEDLVPLTEIREVARRLREQAGAVVTDPDRRAWFRSQLAAVEAYAAEVEDEPLPFLERQRSLHGLRIEPPRASRIRTAWKEIDAIADPPTALAREFETWWERYQVSSESLGRAFELALAHARRVSARHLALPEPEAIEIAVVEKKAWWAYTWFLGQGRSRIDVNRDREYHAAFVLHMAAHEGYPGHHAEMATREDRLVRVRGRPEWTVYPYFTPQACMIEATAEVAAGLVIGDPSTRAWLRDVFLPAVGHEAVDIDAWLVSYDRLMRLRRVAEMEALWFWCEPDRRWIEDEILTETLGGGSVVRERVRGHPALRSFGPCYTVGRDLVQRYVDLGKPWERFARLVTAPLTPDLVSRWIREESGEPRRRPGVEEERK